MRKERTFINLLIAQLLISLLMIAPAGAGLNTGRLDTGFDPGTGANDKVWSVAIHPEGRIYIGGDFTSFNGTSRGRIARLRADGTLDTLFNPVSGANNTVNALLLQPDGKLLIGGNFTLVNGMSRVRIARLNSNGTLDTSFDAGTGANNDVLAMALQPDGKVLIAGDFTAVDGSPRGHIARLNPDGSLDTGFHSSTGADGSIEALGLQADGKVLIGGWFSNVNNTARNKIARLTASGSLDTGFDPGTGPNNTIISIALQSDGKVLIGGSFTSFTSSSRNRIARLNTDGSLDTSFDPGTGANSTVRSITFRDDNKILMAGLFSEVDGTTRWRVARLDSDGSLDTDFDPGDISDSWVLAAVLQADGKLLIGGWFTDVDGVSRNRIARLNADGSLDYGLDTGNGSNGIVYDAVTTTNEKVFVGGNFTEFAGWSRNRIARLNANGSVDQTFCQVSGTGANDGVVQAIAVQPDGKVLIGGSFTQVDFATHKYLARLNHDGSLDAQFNPGTGPNGQVYDIALQSDGKIIIVGSFSTVSGYSRSGIARLNSNGSVDTGFDPGTGADRSPECIALQSDGKILIGGFFTLFNSIGANRIVRLNTDGSVDVSFNTGTGLGCDAAHPSCTPYAETIALQSDGKILVGGSFYAANGFTSNFIVRLNSDGSVDTGFDIGTGFDHIVYDIVVQPDGRIIVVGVFTHFNDIFRSRIVRLNEDGTMDTSFDPGDGADHYLYAAALQPGGKIVIAGQQETFDSQWARDVARLNGGTPPTLIWNTLPPDAIYKTHYSYTFHATGFPEPSFYIASGDVPSGLTLNSQTGELSGLPISSGGSYTFIIVANNFLESSDSSFVTINLEGPTLGGAMPWLFLLLDD